MMQNVIRIFFQIPIIDIIRKHHNHFIRLVIGDKARIITGDASIAGDHIIMEIYAAKIGYLFMLSLLRKSIDHLRIL